MRFISLCAISAMPAPGELKEFSCAGRQICVANDQGRYAAVENLCPHRGGPLAEGSIEDGKVLCPWHAWGFSLETGQTDHGGADGIEVFPLRVHGESVLIGVES